MRRPLSTWALLAALAVMAVGAGVAGNELRISNQQKVVNSAVLNADTVIALTIRPKFTSAGDLAPSARISTADAMDMQTDVAALSNGQLLDGLEVWRLDGSLLFADASHARTKFRLAVDERRRALAGGFTQPGPPTEDGVGTWEVFRPYDANGDGTADAVIEVALPTKGQARVEAVTRRLYGALTLLVLLGGLGLFRFNKRLRQREFEATHDLLTGLGNRLALEARDAALSRESCTTAALVLLDLDGFKAVNDTLGHHAGDDLLVQVARTLESLVSPTDLVTRLGGDEFAVLLAGPRTRESALATAQALIAGLAGRGFCVNGVLLDVHASAGVAMRPDDAVDVAGLVQRADVAMYQAKQRGAGALPYDADEDPHDVPKLELLAQLRHAIDRQELFLDYQPKIDLLTGQVCGVEALVRWQHPERGLLAPDTFVPIAEHTALIAPLTTWVLTEACRQAAAWQAAGMPLSVAVNVSPRSLFNGDLPALVLQVLASTGLPAALLEVEITETAMLVDPDGAVAVLQQLRAMGVRVSLDDFGTGFTSLLMLQNLPVTALKIDRAFVTGMLTGRDDAAVAESLIALARRLGLIVVAEGVETAHVLDRLRALGCDQAQGFHLARPLPAAEVPTCVTARAVVDLTPHPSMVAATKW